MMDDYRFAFDTNGYLVIPDTLRPDEVAALNEALDRELTQRRDTFYSRIERTYQSVRVLEVETAFDTLIAHPSTFGILKALMDDDIAFSEFSIIVKETDSVSHAHWHKDVGYRGASMAQSLLLISCIYYLTDVPSHGACFTVTPGSHRFERPIPEVARIEDMPTCVPLVGRAGTAIIFHANLWHAALPNCPGVERRTAHLYYCRPWMKPTGHTNFPSRLLASADTDAMKRFYHANWGAVK
ncbi:MAG: phytanoyl-CoA dioxygenase family protein [candidate division Zixibacteria bacterium]|nr:phytanoyl-CoA dioxygenase family protein [candidate division Zixibacteria bacterium]